MSEDERERLADQTPPPSEPPEPPEQPPQPPEGRRRRSRWWWLLRGPVYLLLLVILLLAGLYFFLQSSLAKERALGMVQARLAEILDREVEVGSLDWSLRPLALEARDVVVPSPWPGEPPFAVVPYLRIDARIENWANWRQPVLELDQVYLERPVVFLDIRPDGSNNLPDFLQRDSGAQRLEVRLGALVVEDGRFRFEERELPFSLDAKAVTARLTEASGAEGFAEDDRALEGLVVAQDLVFQLPGGRPYAGAVSAKGVFSSRRVELATLRFSGPDLRAHAEGLMILPETERRLELSVAATGDTFLLARLGYMDRDEPPVAGPFNFDGALRWTPEAWRVEGPLGARRLELAGRTLTGVEGTLSVVSDDLRYVIDRAGYAGGSIQGTVAVDLDAPAKTIAVDLELAGLDLATLADDQDLELEGLAGRVGGEVSYRFSADDPLAGSGWADLAVSAVGDRRTRSLPLSGRVPLEIDRGRLRTRAARLATPSGSQVIEAEGSYDLVAGRGAFEYRVRSEDLGALAALVPVDAAEGPPVWLPTAGRGTIDGELRLAGGDLTTDVVFDLAEVVTAAVAADALEGSLTASATGIERMILEGSSGGGAIMMTGSVPFGDAPGSGPPFDLTIDAEGWPLDERTAALLPGDIEVVGRLSGRLELAGSVDALTGSADLTLAGGRVAGYEVDDLAARLAFTPGEVVVEEATADTDAGAIIATGNFDVVSGELDFQVRSPSLDLDREPFASALAGLTGRASLDATIGGTLESPEVRADIVGTSLEVGGRALGDARLTLAWDGTNVRAQGDLPGLLTLAGGGTLTTEGADLAIEIGSDRLGAVLASIAPDLPVSFSGGFQGELVVQGPFADPEALVVALRLDRLEIGYEDRRLINAVPVEARYTGDALMLDTFYLVDLATESELIVQGRLGLAGEQPLDLNVQSVLASDWLELALPEVELDGVVEVLGSVGGTLEKPAINGQGRLANGRLIVPTFPQTLDEIEAVVLFYPDGQMVLDRLSAEIGNGDLRASGQATLFGPQGLEYRVQALVEGFNLRYPEGFWLRGDAAVTVSSTPDGRLVRGNVELTRAYYLKDIETSVVQLLRRAMRTQRLEVAEVGEVESSTELAITISAPPGAVRVRNNLADLTGEADLVVRGTVARPALFGTVELEPGGTLVYSDNEFEVQRARLTFASTTGIDPIVDLTAITEARSYDVTLNLAGRIDDLQVTLASDPPLSDLDMVALLATGKTFGERTEATESGSGGAEALIAGQAASVVSERVNTLFGFDKFRISPATERGGSIGGVGITVGKQVSRDIFVTYTELPGATAEGRLFQVEWQVDDNLDIVLTARGDGKYAVDARWKRRF